MKAGENSYTLSNQPFQTSLKFKDESNQLNISIQITTHSYYGEPPFFKNIIVKRGKGMYMYRHTLRLASCNYITNFNRV